MKFENKISVRASKATLDGVLADIPTVARFIPGVESVTNLGGDSYEGTMKVRVGPMGFTFSGKVEVDQDIPSGRWIMKAQARDPRGGTGITASINVQMTEIGDKNTELEIVTDVQFLGRLGEMGQPLIRKKAAATIQEFAVNLQDAVDKGGDGT
jgi:carbon monoxide dehydrogenase subunit G